MTSFAFWTILSYTVRLNEDFKKILVNSPSYLVTDKVSYRGTPFLKIKKERDREKKRERKIDKEIISQRNPP